MSFHEKKNLCILLLMVLTILMIFPRLAAVRNNSLVLEMRKEELLCYHHLLKEVTKDYFPKDINKQQELEKAELIIKGWEEEVTYGRMEEWLQLLEKAGILQGENSNLLLKPNDKYRDNEKIEKEEAEACIDVVLEKLDREDKIQFQSFLVLGNHENVTDLEGKEIDSDLIFTDNGKWNINTILEEEIAQKKIECLTYAGSIWSVRNILEEAVLENAWIQKVENGEVSYFYKNYYVKSKYQYEGNLKNHVADLTFHDGSLKDVKVKNERLTAKAEKITEEEIELKGVGVLPLEKEVQYYRLYGPLEAVGRSEIPLEEGMADYVIENGKIQAVLLVKDKKMEQLRVLVKTKDFAGIYHDSISISSEVDMDLIYEDQKIVIPAGKEIILEPESKYFVSNRVYLRPKALTGRIYLPQLERSNQNQGYLGTLEIEKREEGLILINEVLLEEYLYAVVPSEMPSSYPMEALKAQAITARTYAYKKMKFPALAEYGANLDDSTSYQVYNNIPENENTTRAVKETKDQLLCVGEEPADTYYYSTSCGFGTDLSVWQEEGTVTYPYLNAKEMRINGRQEELDIQEEEIFSEFIQSSDQNHFECQESWYRWTYEHSNIEGIKEKILDIIQNNEKDVIISGKKEDILKADFKILDIQVEERNAGGVVKSLLFITDAGEISIKNEYRIRSILAEGETPVHLHNDQTYECKQLLPSAFFIVDTWKEEGKVVKIGLTGGGFGHGVGMSQNGAKNLASLGYDAEKILEFYYEGCSVRRSSDGRVENETSSF